MEFQQPPFHATFAVGQAGLTYRERIGQLRSTKSPRIRGHP